MAEKKQARSYRWAAFSHWINLSFLVAGGIAGATIDPIIWALMVPAQLALLWTVPDLPPFRAAVDRDARARSLLQERAYYVEQLWGLHPRPPPRGNVERVLSWFVESDVDDIDERIMGGHGRDCEQYLEMRRIHAKLKDMAQVAKFNVSEADLDRVERVINGYLRILFACRPLAKAVAATDERELQRQHAEIEQRLKTADDTLRAVLLERKRLLQMQLDRHPKLKATLELFHARAQAIVFQLNNIHSQVVSDPGREVHGMLDEIIERNDMLADPLAELAADQSVREFLEPDLEGLGLSQDAPARRARRQGAAR